MQKLAARAVLGMSAFFVLRLFSLCSSTRDARKLPTNKIELEGAGRRTVLNLTRVVVAMFFQDLRTRRSPLRTSPWW